MHFFVTFKRIHCELEIATLAKLGINFNVPTKAFANHLADGQPDSYSIWILLFLTFTLVKGLEYIFSLFRVHSKALINN